MAATSSYVNKWGRPQSRWAVQTKAHCRILVDLFDEYPLWSKKARDYAIWRQAVHEIRAVREYQDAPDLDMAAPEPMPSLLDLDMPW